MAFIIQSWTPCSSSRIGAITDLGLSWRSVSTCDSIRAYAARFAAESGVKPGVADAPAGVAAAVADGTGGAVGVELAVGGVEPQAATIAPASKAPIRERIG